MEDMDIIVLKDDEGHEHEYEVLDYLEVDDQEYVILAMPESEDEAFMLRVDLTEDGEETFTVVEDDEEWDRVAAAWEALLDEEEDIELLFEEDEMDEEEDEF